MVAVVVGKVRVQESRQRQGEIGVHVGLARQAHRRDGRAVIAGHAGDDLAPLWLPHRVPVVPGELDGGVVRLRARALQQHLRHRHRRDLEQLAGELDRGGVRDVAIDVVVADVADLFVGGAGEALAAEAERRAPQAGGALDVAPALGVDDLDALPARHDARPARRMRLQVGLRMDQARDVHRRQAVRAVRHRCCPRRCHSACSSDQAASRAARRQRADEPT